MRLQRRIGGGRSRGRVRGNGGVAVDQKPNGSRLSRNEQLEHPLDRVGDRLGVSVVATDKERRRATVLGRLHG